jgi:hypothetical protein
MPNTSSFKLYFLRFLFPRAFTFDLREKALWVERNSLIKFSLPWDTLSVYLSLLCCLGGQVFETSLKMPSSLKWCNWRLFHE